MARPHSTGVLVGLRDPGAALECDGQRGRPSSARRTIWPTPCLLLRRRTDGRCTRGIEERDVRPGQPDVPQCGRTLRSRGAADDARASTREPWKSRPPGRRRPYLRERCATALTLAWPLAN
jgi:hypothetical protein